MEKEEVQEHGEEVRSCPFDRPMQGECSRRAWLGTSDSKVESLFQYQARF